MSNNRAPLLILGARVRLARQARNLNQRDLAARIQSSQNYISELEAGKMDAKLTMLLKLSEALGVSVEWLTRQEAPERALFAADARASYEVDPPDASEKRNKTD